jgi:hypothetical protein
MIGAESAMYEGVSFFRAPNLGPSIGTWLSNRALADCSRI